MKDRAMQALYKLALEPIAETKADRHSYGFQTGEISCCMLLNSVTAALSCKRMAKWIFEADIEGCFDNIDHNWLINNITMDKDVLKKMAKSWIYGIW